MDDYNTNRMSCKAKNIYERGKFFIETGTTQSFKHFLLNSAKELLTHTPAIVIFTIEELIANESRDEALKVWKKTCADIDRPTRSSKILILCTTYMVLVGVLSVLAIIKSYLN